MEICAKEAGLFRSNPVQKYFSELYPQHKCFLRFLYLTKLRSVKSLQTHMFNLFADMIPLLSPLQSCPIPKPKIKPEIVVRPCPKVKTTSTKMTPNQFDLKWKKNQRSVSTQSEPLAKLLLSSTAISKTPLQNLIGPLPDIRQAEPANEHHPK